MYSRKIYNFIQQDHVTFLKTSVETNGEDTLVEVELADGEELGCIIIKHTLKNLIVFFNGKKKNLS